MLIKIVKIILALVLVLFGLGLFGVWYIGAWNLVFPSQAHELEPPKLPAELTSRSILVFSKTNSFRHKDGIAGGTKAIKAIAAQNNWSYFFTENGAVFNARDLALFDTVVFLNATGDLLNAQQEMDFQNWLENGGGWLGLHAAGDSSHAGWQWYRENFIGADFTAHTMGPQFQTATVMMENQRHPVASDIPDQWSHEEEWYSWEESPRVEGFTILATLDEKSYSPVQNFMGMHNDLSMGDHPVVWTNCIGSGRSVYAAMGHNAQAFEQPQVRQLIVNALSWLKADASEECPAP